MVRHGWALRTLVMMLFMVAAINIVRPMVSYRALELGASTPQLGLIAASFAALPLLLAVAVGRLVDRHGEPLFCIFGTLLVCVVALGLTRASNIGALAVAQGFLGLGALANAVGAQALMVNAGPPDRRDTRISAHTMVVSAGQMVGPAVGGVLVSATGSISAAWFSAAAGAALATMLATSLAFRPASDNERGASSGGAPASTYSAIGTVLRRPGMPHALLASLTVLSTVDILIAYLPAYGQARGLSVAAVGLLLSARAGASIAARAFVMILIRRFGRRATLTAGLLLPALAVLLIPSTTSTPVLFVAMLAAGFGLGLGTPLTLVWMANTVPVNLRGMALGMRISANRTGQIAIPALLGIVAGATGLWIVFVAMSLLLGASAGSVHRSPLDV